MMYPFAESIANKIRIPMCVTVCDVTRELYGYTRFVFDYEKAKATFIGEYSTLAKQLKRSIYPTRFELDSAIGILESRSNRVIS